MSNIINVCKVFLDFIYENNILPKKIKEDLERYYETNYNHQETYQWDIRVIANILQYYQDYRSDKSDFKEQILRDINTFNELSQECQDWLNRQGNRRRFQNIQTECNNFFHNVNTTNTNVFIEILIDIIQDADFVPTRETYINKIKEEVKEYHPNKRNEEVREYHLNRSNKEEITIQSLSQPLHAAKIWPFKRCVTGAVEFCKAHNIQISPQKILAAKKSELFGRQEVYWCDIKEESLNNEWTLILNNYDRRTLYILQIPAHIKINLNNCGRNRDLIDLNIRIDNLTDIKSGFDFSPYCKQSLSYTADDLIEYDRKNYQIYSKY